MRKSIKRSFELLLCFSSFSIHNSSFSFFTPLPAAMKKATKTPRHKVKKNKISLCLCAFVAIIFKVYFAWPQIRLALDPPIFLLIFP